MGTPRVTYVFHRPPYEDYDLDTLSVCFYLSRFCSVVIDFNKNNLTTGTFVLTFDLAIDVKNQLHY